MLFSFSNGPQVLNIPSDEVKNNLPEIIKIFESKTTDNVKKNKLCRLHLYPKRKYEKADFLVKNFKGNKELQKRIDGILAWRKETGFKRKKIENEPTKEELQLAQEKAAEVADKKWREENPERYKKFLAAQKLYFAKKQDILKKGREGYWENHKKEHEEAVKELNKLGAEYYRLGRR